MRILAWGLLLALAGAAAANERVLARDVQTLLFKHGELSTSTRGPPVLQLVQAGGPPVPVSQILCTNAGWDGRQVIWECRLPAGVAAELASFDVSCQGFDRPGDPYILAGSCGIKYTLRAAPAASPRVSAPPRMPAPAASSAHEPAPAVAALGAAFSGFSLIVLISIPMMLLVSMCIALHASLRRAPCAGSPRPDTPVPPRARSNVRVSNTSIAYDELDDIAEPRHRSRRSHRTRTRAVPSVVVEQVAAPAPVRVVEQVAAPAPVRVVERVVAPAPVVQVVAPAPAVQVVRAHSGCNNCGGLWCRGCGSCGNCGSRLCGGCRSDTFAAGYILGSLAARPAPVIEATTCSRPAPSAPPVAHAPVDPGGAFSERSCFGGTTTR